MTAANRGNNVPLDAKLGFIYPTLSHFFYLCHDSGVDWIIAVARVRVRASP